MVIKRSRQDSGSRANLRERRAFVAALSENAGGREDQPLAGKAGGGMASRHTHALQKAALRRRQVSFGAGLAATEEKPLVAMREAMLLPDEMHCGGRNADALRAQLARGPHLAELRALARQTEHGGRSRARRAHT